MYTVGNEGLFHWFISVNVYDFVLHIPVGRNQFTYRYVLDCGPFYTSYYCYTQRRHSTSVIY